MILISLIGFFFQTLYGMQVAVESPILNEKACIEANEGIFFESKKIEVPLFPHAYNPTIVARDGGYVLFFVMMNLKSIFFLDKKLGACTYIGYCVLSKDLDVISDPKLLDLKSSYAEDPRAVSFDGKTYVFYNDVSPLDSFKRRMKLAVLNESTLKVEQLYFIPGAKRKVEKNWTPIVFEEEGIQKLGFIYSFDELSLLKIDFHNEKISVKEVGSKDAKNSYPLVWLKRYGFLRGGAPVFFAEDHYWAFFHSYFKTKTPITPYRDRKDFFYVGGLTTFKIHPSIQFEKISRYPILYEGAFDTQRVRCFDKMVIYPSGCVFHPESKQVVLAVGENDSGIKLLRAHLDQLKNSLVEVAR